MHSKESVSNLSLKILSHLSSFTFCDATF